VYPRVKAGHLLYRDVMPELGERRWHVRLAGVAMLLAGESGAWVAGNLISSGYWKPHFLPLSFAATPYDKAIAVVVSPFILLAFAGMMLL
jgi:hypothetical protein